MWVDFVWIFRGYLCKRTWERPDWWESRACFRPVAVKQVKVDIRAGRLELRRFYREPDDLCVAIAKSKKEDAIESRTGCNDEEAASQERLDPIAYGYWGRQSGVCHRRDEFEHTALGSIGLSSRPTLGYRLVMVAPHDDAAKVKANL